MDTSRSSPNVKIPSKHPSRWSTEQSVSLETFFRSFQLIFPIDNDVLVHRRAACLLPVSWACSISSEEEIKIRTSSVSYSHKTGGQRPHPLAGWCCQDLGRHTRNSAVLGTRLVRVRWQVSEPITSRFWSSTPNQRPRGRDGGKQALVACGSWRHYGYTIL